jgi:hypothetical protein
MSQDENKSLRLRKSQKSRGRASRTTARCPSTIPVPVPWLFQFPNPPCLPTADGQRSKRALPRNRIEDLFHSLSVGDVSPSYSTQCSSK